MHRFLFITLLGIFLYPLAFGQSKERRAQKFFDKSLHAEVRKKHEQARFFMEKALREDRFFSDAYSTLGAWYFKDHRFEKSAAVFRRAYQSVPNGKRQFVFPLAKALVYQGNVTEALTLIPFSDTSEAWQKLRTQALFVQAQKGKQWKDTAFNLGIRINSSDAEMFPWISRDEETLFFTRRVNRSDEDFFEAEADSCGGWLKAENMGRPPNTPHQESAQMISADGHYMFFMRCENRSPNGWEQGGCDLYMSYRSDSTWSVPQSFGATINTPAYEGMPCLSPDNKELYFISDREGGFGGLDIWVSRFENGFWQEPQNLGPEINTEGNETAPYIHIDNQTLYFSSDTHPGFGGSDFFMSKKTDGSTWSKPVNMGAPVNTSTDEASLCLNVEGNKVFFASDRDSISGNFDIYEMNLPEPLRPLPVNAVKGFVYDSISRARLSYASIYIKDTETGETISHYNSNRGDGSFSIFLPSGKKYALQTSRLSFKEGNDTLDLTVHQPKIIQRYNISLLPSDYVMPVDDSLILTIHFPINQTFFSDSDKSTLHQVMAPWLTNMQGITVFVNSFTDNSGTPMINEQISYQRANLVAEEIIALGIHPLQVKATGWGEADPVAPNDTEEGKNRNRRVEIIIRR